MVRGVSNVLRRLWDLFFQHHRSSAIRPIPAAAPMVAPMITFLDGMPSELPTRSESAPLFWPLLLSWSGLLGSESRPAEPSSPMVVMSPLLIVIVWVPSPSAVVGRTGSAEKADDVTSSDTKDEALDGTSEDGTDPGATVVCTRENVEEVVVGATGATLALEDDGTEVEEDSGSSAVLSVGGGRTDDLDETCANDDDADDDDNDEDEDDDEDEDEDEDEDKDEVGSTGGIGAGRGGSALVSGGGGGWVGEGSADSVVITLVVGAGRATGGGSWLGGLSTLSFPPPGSAVCVFSGGLLELGGSVTAGGSVVEAGGAADVLLSGGARRGIAVHCFPLILVRKAPAGSPDMANRSFGGSALHGRGDWVVIKNMGGKICSLK
jgi:hypothetical protein